MSSNVESAKETNMADDSMDEARHVPTHVIATTPAARFLGSFAADSRQDHRKPAKVQGIKNQVVHYFAEGWNDISIWRSAVSSIWHRAFNPLLFHLIQQTVISLVLIASSKFIELIGTMSLCYLSALIDITIGNFKTTQVGGYVGISNIVLLSLFIYALSPSSGGHVNPVITFSTMTAGLTGFSRGILYMFGQTLGAAIAGGLVHGSFGGAMTKQYGGGGCYFDDSALSDSQIFLIEAMSSFILVFLAFGVGLDPRQGTMFGPKLGPFLTACVLGLITFSSVGLAPGYPGVGINPARCFAFAVARANFQHHWIWWMGPLAGAIFHTAVYHIAPPYHHEKLQERAARRD